MRIWLMQHGETLGGVYEHARHYIPEGEMPLTQWGQRQSQGAGAFLKAYYDDLETRGEMPSGSRLAVFSGSALRAAQTVAGLVSELGEERAETHSAARAPGWEEGRLVTPDVLNALIEEGRDVVIVADGFAHAPHGAPGAVTLIEGDKAQGYTVAEVYRGAERSAHVSADFETDPAGGWPALENRYNVPRHVIRPLPAGQKFPFME